MANKRNDGLAERKQNNPHITIINNPPSTDPVPLKKGKGGFVTKLIAFLAAISTFLGIGVKFYLDSDRPVFHQVRWAYLSQERYMAIDQYKGSKIEKIYNDEISYIIENYSFPQSLIGVIIISLDKGSADNVRVQFEKRVHPDYQNSSMIKPDMLIDATCLVEEDELYLKTFTDGRTVMIPVLITSEYQRPDIKRVADLVNKERIIIEYIPLSITYKNNEWNNIPIFNMINSYKDNIEPMATITILEDDDL